jgi:hypothetical protein
MRHVDEILFWRYLALPRTLGSFVISFLATNVAYNFLLSKAGSICSLLVFILLVVSIFIIVVVIVVLLLVIPVIWSVSAQNVADNSMAERNVNRTVTASAVSFLRERVDGNNNNNSNNRKDRDAASFVIVVNSTRQ